MSLSSSDSTKEERSESPGSVLALFCPIRILPLELLGAEEDVPSLLPWLLLLRFLNVEESFFSSSSGSYLGGALPPNISSAFL
jgi:hypothetical protein